MVFGRKKRSAARGSPSDDGVDGIVRRGLAATTGRLPSERTSSPPRVEGANPYNSTGRVAKRTPAGPKIRGRDEETPYKGANNPYDNATKVPAKKKMSWDDALIGVSKGR
jgi:hypothetical protein